VSFDGLQAAPLLAYSLVHGDGVVTHEGEQGRSTIKFTPVCLAATKR
jgi:hypothetical protein